MAASVETHFGDQIRKGAAAIIWFGIALLVAGVASLVFPAVSTLVTTVFVGWMLVFTGCVTVLGAFSIRGTGPFFGALLFGLLALGAGLLMLARPLTGEITITLILGFLFLLQGASEIFLAFELRPMRGWGWMLTSGVASILLALAIIVGLPGVSLFALGVVIGVNLISSGAAYIATGVLARRLV